MCFTYKQLTLEVSYPMAALHHQSIFRFDLNTMCIYLSIQFHSYLNGIKHTFTIMDLSFKDNYEVIVH